MFENKKEIIELMQKKNISKTRLSELTGYSKGTISDVLNGKIEMSDRFGKIVSQVLLGGSTTEINGDNHHIDIHHAPATHDPSPNYNTANSTLKAIADTLPEGKVWKLVELAAEMKTLEEGK